MFSEVNHVLMLPLVHIAIYVLDCDRKQFWNHILLVNDILIGKIVIAFLHCVEWNVVVV